MVAAVICSRWRWRSSPRALYVAEFQFGYNNRDNSDIFGVAKGSADVSKLSVPYCMPLQFAQEAAFRLPCSLIIFLISRFSFVSFPGLLGPSIDPPLHALWRLYGHPPRKNHNHYDATCFEYISRTLDGDLLPKITIFGARIGNPTIPRFGRHGSPNTYAFQCLRYRPTLDHELTARPLKEGGIGSPSILRYPTARCHKR